jgi:hypothetical protein
MGFFPRKQGDLNPQRSVKLVMVKGLLPLTIVENTVLNELMNG